MSPYGGYAGKVLKIDLSSGTISEYPWSDAQRRAVLGGKAMAARILLDHLHGQETAFSEGNCVVITTSPLTGSGAPGSTRFDIAALSPKDGLPAFSNCGGSFGVSLKKAGYDALILTGRCAAPCWLEIHGDGVLFHDGGTLWGAGTGACQEALGKLLQTRSFGSLCIGPAGEHLVKFAAVIAQGHATGRAGIGAVLGSKNLKAITVTGGEQIPWHDTQSVAAWNRQWHESLARYAAEAHTEGGPSCGSCPLHCKKTHHSDSEAILNELGMDVIAAEDALAWAAARGIPTQGLYEDLAYRRGIGGKLADGVPRQTGRGARRRGGSFRTIAAAFGLSPDIPETETFCRDLTEAISVAGQCIFTLNALGGDGAVLPALDMLRFVTGMELTLEDLLAIGKSSQQLEQALRQRFTA